MKEKILSVLVALETVRRDLYYLECDPEDAEDELPSITAQIDGIISALGDIADELPA